MVMQTAEHDFLLTIIDIRVTLKLKEQSLCSVHSAHCAAGSDPTVEGLSDPFVTIELLPRRIFNNCEAMYVYSVERQGEDYLYSQVNGGEDGHTQP